MLWASATRAYTPAGQLQSEGGIWPSDTVTYGYLRQMLQSLTLTQPGAGSWQQTYAWDAAWRLGSVTSPAGSFTNTFDPLRPNLPVRTALPNGAYVTNHFDALGRLDYTGLHDHWGHPLDAYAYLMDPLGLRTNLIRMLGLTTNVVVVRNDKIGQITSWSAQEMGDGLRQNEQFSFAYDPAGNLRWRTNGGLVQCFTCDALNQLTNVTRTGTLTISGNTPAPATNVTVNGIIAQRYGDFTFACTNVAITNNGLNTFVVVARNAWGTNTTNTLTFNLPASVNPLYDSNGNLTNNGTLTFRYCPGDLLTNITLPTAWKSDFVYDGLGRRRVELDYGWQGGTWTKTNELRFIYWAGSWFRSVMAATTFWRRTPGAWI